MATMMNIDPDRKTPPFRPFKAMHHMNKLFADKEDTEQVFHIIEALNGDSLRHNLKAFAASPKGAQRLAEKRDLPALLDDHAPLWALPEGTVGRAYVEFMEREGLSAQGLVDESERIYASRPRYNDDLEWYGNHTRDMHDLFHVLTGYGRDGLGEAALLAFSYSQNPGRGVIFISWMGFRRARKMLPKESQIMKLYKEGKRHGAIASPLAAEDVIPLLKEPLEDARKRLNIMPPVEYQRVMRRFGAEIDAYDEASAAAA